MNQILGALQKFGIGRLAAILGIGAGVAAALFAVTMGLGQPKALLYSNLDLKEAASNLFAMLRELDKRSAAIAVSPIPGHGLGEAINDRLTRAAAPK